MSIEFDCPGCQSYLRTADEKAGLRIRCPACQEAIWVPSPHERESPFVSVLQTDVAEEPDQPRPDLQTSEVVKGAGLQRPGTVANTVSFDAIVRDTWQIYTRNLLSCLYATAMDLSATVLAIVLTFMIAMAVCIPLQGSPELSILAAICIWVLGMLITYSAITVGNYRYFIGLCRSESPQHSYFQVSQHTIGSLILGWAIFWGLSLAGLSFLVFPGIIAMIIFWPFAAILVDRKIGAVPALKAAAELTTGNFRVAAAVFFLHIGLLILAGTVPLLGHLLALPLAAVLHTVAYLHLSGEMLGEEMRPISLGKAEIDQLESA